MTSDAIELVTHAATETRSVGAALAALLAPGDVVLLAGDLGAGKTQLAQGVAAGLGVEEQVVSPTFTLAREYPARLASGALVRLVHVDVYRLDRAVELADLGLDDLDDGVAVIEWGDVAAAFVPGEHLLVQLDAGAAPDDRVITVAALGRSWVERAERLRAALVPA
jgi:tRNA threonylcarbamoyladenosine biosynthesis protein TsaE